MASSITRDQVRHVLTHPLATPCPVCKAKQDEPCPGLGGMVHSWRGSPEDRLDVLMDLIATA